MSIATAKHTMSTQSQAAVNDGLLHNAMRGPNGTHHLHCGPAMVAAREGAAAAAQDGGQSRQAGCGAGKGSPKRQQHKLTGRENRRNVSHKRLTAAAAGEGGYFILTSLNMLRALMLMISTRCKEENLLIAAQQLHLLYNSQRATDLAYGLWPRLGLHTVN